ncbi:hypothetical protein T4B_12865 [Trichinella pseudospiralis]|uniref:Uncharacterized protein n=1 Tax=Trichinella pseudospiralis TaxID=6337 RepID=A0A0V1IG14_TRIPS|nr:hypothetical protein T4B_12865 [Trichinella pseudospiralis]
MIIWDQFVDFDLINMNFQIETNDEMLRESAILMKRDWLAFCQFKQYTAFSGRSAGWREFFNGVCCTVEECENNNNNYYFFDQSIKLIDRDRDRSIDRSIDWSIGLHFAMAVLHFGSLCTLAFQLFFIDRSPGAGRSALIAPQRYVFSLSVSLCAHCEH